jgi:hypothetical protein
MPCRVDDEPWEPRRETRHGMTIEDFEAVLCGVFTAADRGILIGRSDALMDVVDWKEAGVKRRTVETWWRQHQAEDAERRDREFAERKRADLRAAALGKLTNEERAALGI